MAAELQVIAQGVGRRLIGPTGGLKRVVVVKHAEVRAGFRPDIVRLGGMNPDSCVLVIARVRDLGSIGIARGDKTIDLRRRGIAEDLPRAGLRCGLRPIVVFHCDHEDRLDRARRRCPRENTSCETNGGNAAGSLQQSFPGADAGVFSYTLAHIPSLADGVNWRNSLARGIVNS